ncbi:MAG TPA: hypothetical protein VER55_16755 [Ardenticatenaceae bacterium]|nr:hypothetical protein [Ardenticatenaceae bacterium]
MQTDSDTSPSDATLQRDDELAVRHWIGERVRFYQTMNQQFGAGIAQLGQMAADITARMEEEANRLLTHYREQREAELAGLDAARRERQQQDAELAVLRQQTTVEIEEQRAAAQAERDRLLRDAHAERDRVLEETRNERDRLLGDTYAERDRVLEETRRLSTQLAQLQQALQNLLGGAGTGSPPTAPASPTGVAPAPVVAGGPGREPAPGAPAGEAAEPSAPEAVGAGGNGRADQPAVESPPTSGSEAGAAPRSEVEYTEAMPPWVPAVEDTEDEDEGAVDEELLGEAEPESQWEPYVASPFETDEADTVDVLPEEDEPDYQWGQTTTDQEAREDWAEPATSWGQAESEEDGGVPSDWTTTLGATTPADEEERTRLPWEPSEPPAQAAEPVEEPARPGASGADSDGGATRLAIEGVSRFTLASDIIDGLEQNPAIEEVTLLLYEQGTLLLSVRHAAGTSLERLIDRDFGDELEVVETLQGVIHLRSRL